MNSTEKKTYEIMANALFDQYNREIGKRLPKVPVVMGANSMTRCAGRIIWSKRKEDGWGEIRMGDTGHTYWATIRLSPSFIERGHADEILVETLKHEMAHLWQLVTRGVSDHSDSFRRFCIELGCNPATYHNIGAESDEGEHVYYCPECGEISRYNKRVALSDGGTCARCTFRHQLRIRKQYVGRASCLKRLGVLNALVEEHGLARRDRRAASMPVPNIFERSER